MLTDAFGLNPSSLPTVKTPVGVEGTYNKGKLNFAFIKGLGKVGGGISAQDSEAPFFSNVSNIEVAQLRTAQLRRSTDTEATGAYAPNLNFASAIKILGGNNSKLASNLGLNVKYVREMQEFRPGLGWNFKTKMVNGGFSLIKSPLVGTTLNSNLGGKIFNTLLDFTYMKNMEGDENRTIIASATTVLWRLNMTYAYREQNNKYLDEREANQVKDSGGRYRSQHHLFGGNMKVIQDKLSVGLYHNYVLDGDYSVQVQYIF